ncbi:MAG: CDP-glycerol glycerophosphotransferase family protein [Oscillospiraceae bacterium]
MKLYIDPGTGSMLFAILIGIIGALNFALRGWIIKLRFLLSGGEKTAVDQEKHPLAVFVDDKRYWNVMEPVCRELDRRGLDRCVSDGVARRSSAAKPLRARARGVSRRGQQGLCQAQLPARERAAVHHAGAGCLPVEALAGRGLLCAHPHAANEVAGYRMFGIDYYDTVFVSGDYQIRDLRALEALRGLPAKEVVKIGIPYMDEMKRRLDAAGPIAPHRTTVLIAPSWGPSAIFSKYGGKIIDKLLAGGYHVIIRPHPQSYKSEKDMIDKLMAAYPDSEDLEWNRDNDNFDVLRRADILVSDFSGVIFDFTLVFDKPVIYADTKFDKSPYDCWWLDTPYWTFEILPQIGQQLTEDNFDTLGDMVQQCLTDPKYAQGRDTARAQTWVYPGEGAVRAADYLEQKMKELTATHEEKEP